MHIWTGLRTGLGTSQVTGMHNADIALLLISDFFQEIIEFKTIKVPNKSAALEPPSSRAQIRIKIQACIFEISMEDCL